MGCRISRTAVTGMPTFLLKGLWRSGHDLDRGGVQFMSELEINLFIKKNEIENLEKKTTRTNPDDRGCDTDPDLDPSFTSLQCIRIPALVTCGDRWLSSIKLSSLASSACS